MPAFANCRYQLPLIALYSLTHFYTVETRSQSHPGEKRSDFFSIWLRSRKEQEMIFPHLRPAIQERIISIVVKEFEGIDHLPDDLIALESLR
jgi:hypothetical protein